MTTIAGAQPGFVNRWWTYQRERFPLFAHGPLVLVFSASAVCFSLLLRWKASGQPSRPDWPAPASLLVAFTCCLLMFLQLRIADEFKDYEEDLLHRPYRPVQRGLVKLRQLAVVFVLCAIIQAAAVTWLAPRLLLLLTLAWTYLALMSKEFFARKWLQAHPVAYLLSHMCIMPLIDFLATGCDWMMSPARAPGSSIGLGFFLCASYFNGVVIELGRKIRSPSDEEHGVQTYSALYTPRRAVAWWLAAMAATGVFATAASTFIDAPWIVGPAAATLWIVAFILSRKFLAVMTPGRGKLIEGMSGIWTIGLYLSLGPAALLRAMAAYR